MSKTRIFSKQKFLFSPSSENAAGFRSFSVKISLRQIERVNLRERNERGASRPLRRHRCSPEILVFARSLADVASAHARSLARSPGPALYLFLGSRSRYSSSRIAGHRVNLADTPTVIAPSRSSRCRTATMHRALRD